MIRPQSRNIAAELAAERDRQVGPEGYTPEHDDAHTDGSLARAALAYVAASAIGWSVTAITCWPWEPAAFKPTTRRRNLVKAGALLIAEIERLDRKAEAAEPTT